MSQFFHLTRIALQASAVVALALPAAAAQDGPAPVAAPATVSPVSCTLELGIYVLPGEISNTTSVATLSAATPDVCLRWAADVFRTSAGISAYRVLAHDQMGALVSDVTCHQKIFASRGQTICAPKGR